MAADKVSLRDVKKIMSQCHVTASKPTTSGLHPVPAPSRARLSETSSASPPLSETSQPTPPAAGLEFNE